MNIDDVTQFQQTLLRWFAHHQRQLPWRQIREPYPVWISEVMLQQTQVATVIPYYHRFLKRFPTVQALASASIQDVLKVWEGLGYYARARHLHKAAQWIVENHDGTFPTTWVEWKKLPGVGDYIAAAVASIVFGEAVPVVDGNVKRVLARLFADETPVNSPRANKHFRRLAGHLIPAHQPGNFNQAMMELGATVCLPRNPRCAECPLTRYCTAFQKGLQTQFPYRQTRKAIPTYPIAVGVIIHDGKVLITRRREDGLLGGLWEFPGGKIEPRESAEAACIRELREETGLEVVNLTPLTTVRHAYSHFKVILHVFVGFTNSREVHLNGAVAYRWVSPEELQEYPFPGANRKFFPVLMAYFNNIPKQSRG